MQPTLAGFIEWVRSAMGIPTSAIPDNSIWFPYAYNVAVELVNQQLQVVPGFSTGPTIYTLAVYNLAGDNLVNWAGDDTNPPYVYPGGENPDGLFYFAFLRKKWNLQGFVPGVITASSDVTTSETLEVPDWVKNLTIGNLQSLKTPWGRQYMAFAQSAGTLWGLT